MKVKIINNSDNLFHYFKIGEIVKVVKKWEDRYYCVNKRGAYQLVLKKDCEIIKINKLQKKIINWAKERNLIFPENSKNQLLKTVSELGELSDALLKSDLEAIRDGIGDVLVTLIILAETQGLTLKECLNQAWNEIKDRKGETVNGTFIKP